MAQAQRATVWLEPEEQHEELTPQLRQRRRVKSTKQALWQRPVMVMGTVAGLVGLLVLIVSGHACIARNELQQQLLTQQIAQLDREHVQNQLKIDRLSAQPRLIQLAAQQGLEQPTADRIHYVRATTTFPRTAVARSTTRTARVSWLNRSGRQVMAALHRLGRGPGTPVYVQE